MNADELNQHRFDLVDDKCGPQRMKLRELALLADRALAKNAMTGGIPLIPAATDLVAAILEHGEEFGECCDGTKGSLDGQFVAFSSVQRALADAEATARAHKQEIVSLRAQVEKLSYDLNMAGQANTQLVAAVNRRDHEIMALSNQVATERAVADRLQKMLEAGRDA